MSTWNDQYKAARYLKRKGLTIYSHQKKIEVPALSEISEDPKVRKRLAILQTCGFYIQLVI